MGVAQTAFVLRKSASSLQFQLRLKHLCLRTLSGVEAGKLLQRCMAHTGNHSRLPHININRTHMSLLHRASRAILCPARQVRILLLLQVLVLYTHPLWAVPTMTGIAVMRTIAGSGPSPSRTLLLFPRQILLQRHSFPLIEAPARITLILTQPL